MLGQSGLSLSNRRQSQRLRLCIPVQYFVGSVQCQGEIVDISSGGMCLRVSSQPPAGSLITVSPLPGSQMPGRQQITCRIAWRGFVRPDLQIGLRFQKPPDKVPEYWVQSLLSHLDPHRGRRRFRRFGCDLGVHLLDESKQLVTDGLCLDLSQGGCLIELRRRLGVVGKRFRLGLGAGRFETNLALNSVVLYAVPTPVGAFPRYRIKFLRMEKAQSRRLQGLIRCCLEQAQPFCDEPQLDPEIQDRLCRLVLSKPHLRQAPKALIIDQKPPLETQGTPPHEPLCLPHPAPLKQRKSMLRCPSLWAARTLTLAGGLRCRRGFLGGVYSG